MSKYIVLVVFLLLVLISNAQVQTNNSTQVNESDKSKQDNSVLIKKDRPSIFIEFLRSGKESPLFEGENTERIWLKLNNNTRWEVALCSFNVDKKYGEIGVVYEIQRVAPSIGIDRAREIKDKQIIQPFKKRKTQDLVLPTGYSTEYTCTPYYLEGGKSITFSIPQTHLAKDLFIRIEFWFEWENRDNELGDFPTSYVTFGNSQLPKR